MSSGLAMRCALLALLSASSDGRRAGRFSPARGLLPSLAATLQHGLPPTALDTAAPARASIPSRLAAHPPGKAPVVAFSERKKATSPPKDDWVDQAFNDEMKSGEALGYLSDIVAGSLPNEWVSKFVPDSIAVVPGGGPEIAAGYARLKADPGRVVQFHVLDSKAPETKQELAARRRLRSSGVAPLMLDHVEAEEATYILDGEFSQPLSSALAEADAHADATTDGAALLMPEAKLMPIMAATLRDLVRMHERGVVHGDITEDDIFITDLSDHALLTHFHAACIVDGGAGEDLSCTPAEGAGYDSRDPWRQPPEAVRHDAPETAAGDVWQLGLVFARMVFGRDLVTRESAMRAWPGRAFDEKTEEGREEIRSAVRKVAGGGLALMPGYRSLRIMHPGIVGMIRGMLDRDPERRVTAKEALKHLQSAEPFYLPKPQDTSAREQDIMEAWTHGDDIRNAKPFRAAKPFRS